MAAKNFGKLSDNEVKNFQKELKDFIDGKLGKDRPYQCIISYLLNDEKKGKKRSITTNLTLAGNINSEMPFMMINAILQNLGNGVRKVAGSFYGRPAPGGPPQEGSPPASMQEKERPKNDLGIYR